MGVKEPKIWEPKMRPMCRHVFISDDDWEDAIWTKLLVRLEENEELQMMYSGETQGMKRETEQFIADIKELIARR